MERQRKGEEGKERGRRRGRGGGREEREGEVEIGGEKERK